jgi:competence protein ComEA
MPDLTRTQLALCVAAVAAAVLLGLRYLSAAGGGGGGGGAPVPIRVAAAGDGDGAGAGARVIVHVAGAVRRPGVYRMKAGARVAAAVRRAGGATRRADLSGLNLAAKVEDGRQVLVPPKAPAASAAAPAGGAATTGAAAPPAAPVNLNTATPAQLDELSGVGPATAQKIIAYREEHGGFGTVEELGEVPGIGDVRLAALRDLVTV